MRFLLQLLDNKLEGDGAGEILNDALPISMSMGFAFLVEYNLSGWSSKEALSS